MFGTATVGFTVLPAVVAERVGGAAVAFSGGVAGLVLMTGVVVQPLARRLGVSGSLRPRIAGLLVAAVGLCGSALAVSTRAVILVPVVAVVLGAAYGILFVSGLLEVEQLADRGELAGLTALFYGLIYLGIGVPFGLALFAGTRGYAAPTLIAALAVLLALPPAIIAARRPLPARGASAEKASDVAASADTPISPR